MSRMALLGLLVLCARATYAGDTRADQGKSKTLLLANRPTVVTERRPQEAILKAPDSELTLSAWLTRESHLVALLPLKS